ncbi:MAG: YdjY domain-containing protein [Phycisphaeraceae bacterium]
MHSSVSLRILTAMLLVVSASTSSVSAQQKDPPLPALPGISVDREKKIVDLEGVIIPALQPDWLELLACMPKSREHEAIIRIAAKPSHIHTSLMLIGLKAGTPARVEFKGEEPIYHPPKGDPVAVWIIYEKDGKEVTIPASDWIVNQKTKENLPDNIWLFTGSRLVEIDGKPVYIADVEGNILSLVNFGDEVLARKTKMRGGQGGGGGDTWGANPKGIPKNGTKITVRLTPAKDDGKGDEGKEKEKAN